VLDPNFLKTVSPDLIVAYFNNAKPEDLKAGDGFGFDVSCLAAKVFYKFVKVIYRFKLVYPVTDTSVSSEFSYL
jgi:hypothetical protein